MTKHFVREICSMWVNLPQNFWVAAKNLYYSNIDRGRDFENFEEELMYELEKYIDKEAERLEIMEVFDGR